jgi:hypothetical protein
MEFRNRQITRAVGTRSGKLPHDLAPSKKVNIVALKGDSISNISNCQGHFLNNINTQFNIPRMKRGLVGMPFPDSRREHRTAPYNAVRRAIRQVCCSQGLRDRSSQ